MRVLRWAVQTPARYIGMIGSKRKTITIFQELTKEGLAAGAVRSRTCPGRTRHRSGDAGGDRGRDYSRADCRAPPRGARVAAHELVSFAQTRARLIQPSEEYGRIGRGSLAGSGSTSAFAARKLTQPDAVSVPYALTAPSSFEASNCPRQFSRFDLKTSGLTIATCLVLFAPAGAHAKRRRRAQPSPPTPSSKRTAQSVTVKPPRAATSVGHRSLRKKALPCPSPTCAPSSLTAKATCPNTPAS